jgi:hypothetical protein
MARWMSRWADRWIDGGRVDDSRFLVFGVVRLPDEATCGNAGSNISEGGA